MSEFGDPLIGLGMWALFFGLGCLHGYQLCARRSAEVVSRAEEAERMLAERWDVPMEGWTMCGKYRKRAEKLRRGAAEALRRERANTLAAAVAGHASSLIVATSLAGRATDAAERWRDRCRKVRAGAARRIRTLNEQLREAKAETTTAPPRRIDQAGRDVTGMPGLWDETDERVRGS